jgi:protein-arginine kinase activator protein McsA
MMSYINQGRERIQFDRKGKIKDLHILECTHCKSEFRSTMNTNQIKCSNCSTSTNPKMDLSLFKVIGFIENLQGSEVRC